MKRKMDLQLFAGEFAHGTVLTLGGGIGAVANLTSINGIELTTDDLDVTDHNSVDGVKEYIPGLIEPGEVPVTGHFNPAVVIDFYDAQIARTMLTSSTIVFSDAASTTWTFTCYVNSVKTDAPHDGVIPFEGKLKVTGKPILS